MDFKDLKNFKDMVGQNNMDFDQMESMLGKLDPGMLEQLAEMMAKQHVSKLTNDLQDPTGGACSVPPSMQGPPIETPPSYPMPGSEPMKITRDNAQLIMEKAETLACDECGYHVFKTGVIIKRISKFISPTGEDMVTPIQVFQCGSCDYINEMFLPRRVIADVEAKKANTNKPKTRSKKKKG